MSYDPVPSRAASMVEALLPRNGRRRRGWRCECCTTPGRANRRRASGARQRGAFAGSADVLIEMGCYSRSSVSDRRRKLRAWSRHPETPRELVVELTADGRGYLALGNFEVEAEGSGWRVVWKGLDEDGGKLTRRELLARWPEGVPAPAETTLWRWLERPVTGGRLCRSGGKQNTPFRYWLSGR